MKLIKCFETKDMPSPVYEGIKDWLVLGADEDTQKMCVKRNDDDEEDNSLIYNWFIEQGAEDGEWVIIERGEWNFIRRNEMDTTW